MNSDFTGFVLAGGKSSRMGSDKFALELNGETFLRRAVTILEPVCQSVKIVLNQTQTVETNLPIVRDIYHERGALGGIHAALSNCDSEFAFVLAVDLPFVTRAAVEKLTAFADANPSDAIVPVQSDGRFQPLCAIYHIRSLPAAERLLENGASVSMRQFLGKIKVGFLPQAEISDHGNLFFNVNTPAELNLVGGGIS